MVQVIVYPARSMMLFLFVLMMVGVDSTDSLVETIRGQRLAALLFGIGFVVLVAGAVIKGIGAVPNSNLDSANSLYGGNVQGSVRWCSPGTCSPSRSRPPCSSPRRSVRCCLPTGSS